MGSEILLTVESIVNYVKPKIDNFRKFPSDKDKTIDELKTIFSVNSQYTSVVIKDGKFLETFFRKMGKGRMKALKKILYSIDKKYYEGIDFRED